jgi:4-hydroxyacetophenone monooxygenase
MSHPNATELRTAVEAADLRVLAMSLFHISGDRRWLEPPFQPRRDVQLVPDPTGRLSLEAQSEIRDAMIAALANGVPTPVIDDPGIEVFAEMMNVCLGEIVPAEYVPMARQDMGFDDGDTKWQLESPSDALGAFGSNVDVPVLVIGAGVCGITLSIKLAKLGIQHTVIEKNADVGGTWFENRYPGCGVDTPNQFYSFAFAPNPDWGFHFSPRNELQAYLQDVAQRFGLQNRIQFQTELIAATWDDGAQHWRVTLRELGPGSEGSTDRKTAQDNGTDGDNRANETDGDNRAQRRPTERTMTCRVLVTAIGHFNRPNDITIPGTENFTGDVFHSARWPEGLDLSDKRVALVGTGATSVQIAPAIVKQVKSLTIYQRSPQWVREVPGINDPVTQSTPWLMANVPYYEKWMRFTQFWRYGDGLLQWLRKDPEWPHPERSLNRVNDRHREETTAYIHSELAGRDDLIAKCLPDYPPYGKRILLDKGWYKTLVQSHVELVTEAIDHLGDASVVTSDGVSREADVVIMALGFSVTDLAARLNITGKNDKALAKVWANDDPRAYLGISVPGFPNLFCMYGPNTNTGHGGSGFGLAQSQSRYITAAVTLLAETNTTSMECKQAALDEYIDRMDTEHQELIWTHPGMSTYYRNANGRVVSVMPWRLVDYWSMTEKPDVSDFVFH